MVLSLFSEICCFDNRCTRWHLSTEYRTQTCAYTSCAYTASPIVYAYVFLSSSSMQHGKKHKVLFNNEASVYFGAAVCHFLLYSGKTGHLANRANSQQASMDFSFSPGSVKTGSTACRGGFLT